MKKLHKIIALSLAFLMPMASPNKAEASEINIREELKAPEAGYYFPKDIIDWSLSKYPDQINNISKEKLAERYELEGKTANSKKNPGAGVMAITIANEHTSGTAPQGSDNYKDGYAFTNWQYVDSMIYWGGSAGEGIIVTPAADFVDSAHKNGVAAVGTVFFPPRAYGGRDEWVRDFLIQDENGNFIIADKLIEIASTLGFDGWFINQETDIYDPGVGQKFQEFLDYFKSKSNLKIVWYDAMLPSGQVIWQGALNDKNAMYFQKNDKKRSDEFFVDFRWFKDKVAPSRAKALELGRDPLKVYFGLDAQGQNLNRVINATYPSKPLSHLTQDGSLQVSLGFYCPDSVMRSASSLDGEAFWNKVWENEKLLWINDKGNLNENPSYSFGGVSTYFPERTPITSFPFTSYFNQGAGENYYKDGKILRPGTFYNRSTQDIMPTYRWDIVNEAGNNLRASLDVMEVYNGGSSLKLWGQAAVGGYTDLILYGANAKLDNSHAEILKKGPGQIDLILEFEDGNKAILAGTVESGDWDRVVYDLGSHLGKTVRKIGLRFNHDQNEDIKVNIGKLQIGQREEENITFSSIKVANSSVNDGMSANISLNYETEGKNYGINTYYYDKEGRKNFLSFTKNNAVFIKNLKRLDDDTETIKIELVPVDRSGNEQVQNAQSLDYSFGKLPKPTADFTLDKTFAKVGETITLTESDSISTSQYIWEVPGADKQRQEGRQVSISFDKPGVYSVRHIAKNKTGQDTIKKENLITIYDSIPQESVNIAPKSIKATASGFVGANESPAKAIDDRWQTKWCDNRNEKPWLLLELDKEYTITSFEVWHAEAGGEARNMNSKDFSIETSLDGANFEKIVDVKNNQDRETTHPVIARAKFVRLSLDKAEQNGNVARIYEFRVFGFEGDFGEVVENANDLSKLRDAYFDTKLSDEQKAKADVENLRKLEDLRAKAKAILDQNKITPADFNLPNDLRNAYEDLFTKKSTNKTKLAAQLKYANSINKDDLTPTSKDSLAKSIEKGQEVFDNPDASQEEVDKAGSDIIRASFSIEKVNINRTNLKAAIDQAQGLDYKMYTDDSIKILESELTKAKNVYSNNKSMQVDVDKAHDNLKMAITNLKVRSKVDKRKLESLILRAERYEADNYSQNRWDEMQKLLNEAKRVNKDPLASQAEVNVAHNNLLRAVFSLK